MAAPFSFVVPLDWTSAPWAANSTPTAWLDVNGKKTIRWPAAPDATDEPGDLPRPVRFKFRLEAPMVDLLKIERRLDDVNGGIGETVDLDMGIDGLYRSIRARLEASLWPDGRPKATSPEEDAANDAEIDALYLGPTCSRDRNILNRMHMLRDRQKVAAEWAVLIVDPPAGWEDLATRPLAPGVAETIALAYMNARGEAARAAGK